MTGWRVIERVFVAGWDNGNASQMAQPRAYMRTPIRKAGATSPKRREHERV